MNTHTHTHTYTHTHTLTQFTIPLPDAANDGRPKAIQLETSAISIENHTLDSLLLDEDFNSAVDEVKKGWVFSTQSEDTFPHLAGDFEAFPEGLRKLLPFERERTSSFSAHAQSSPVSRRSNWELRTREVYHFHTSCVHLAFADSYTLKSTIETRSFVNDFPLHVWIFPPPKDTKSETSPPPSPQEDCPTYSFIAHAPQLIRAELERLQMLFLLRMKESFVFFKDSLMKFLTLSGSDAILEASIRTVTQASDDGVIDSRDELESAFTAGDSNAEAVSSGDLRSPSPGRALSPMDISASVGGCVILQALEMNILLPSLYTSNNSKGTNTEQMIPEEPLPCVLMAPPMGISKSRSSISLPVTKSTFGTPSHPLKHTYSHSQPPTPFVSPRISPVSSQTNLAVSQSGQTSFTASLQTSTSGSVTSLPVVTEILAKSHEVAKFSSATCLSVQEHLSRTHTRSHSASDIVPGGTGPAGFTPVGVMGVVQERTASPDIPAVSTTVSGTGSGNETMQDEEAGSGTRAGNETVQGPITDPLHATTELNPVSFVVGESGSRLATSEVGRSQFPMLRRSSPSIASSKAAVEDFVMVEVGHQTSQTRFVSAYPAQQVSKPPLPVPSTQVQLHRPARPDTPDAQVQPVSKEATETEMAPVVAGATSRDHTNLRSKAVSEENLDRTESPLPRPEADPVKPQADIRSVRSSGSAPSPRGTSSTSRRSSRSSIGARRVRSPTPLPNVPQYTLRICTSNVLALPNIKTTWSSFRMSIDGVKLEEIDTTRFQQLKDSFLSRQRHAVNECPLEEGKPPMIKLRLELGNDVQRLYPGSSGPASTSSEDDITDSIVMVKVDGLEASLLLPNTVVLKNFFDDEYINALPIPLQIRLENCKICLKDEMGHSVDSRTTMNIELGTMEVFRGRKVKGTNLFPEEDSEAGFVQDLRREASSEQEVERRLGEGGGVSDEEHARTRSNAGLLQSFQSFIEVFQSHVQRHGETVNLPQPEKVAGLLDELKFSLSDPEEAESRVLRPPLEAPPSYQEALSHGSSPRSSPVHRRFSRGKSDWRREADELKRLQLENEQLAAELAKANERVDEQSKEFEFVIEECKQAKLDVAMYKQVLDNQKELFERMGAGNT